MKIIGVTGGIGSGKSTVAQILSTFGGRIIDADSIAKEVVGKGEKALGEIRDQFGPAVINGAGELDRAKLASIVFNDSEKLKALNNITHKYVVERILEDIRRYREDGVPFVILDVPIPVKSGFLDVAHEIWVVSADMETRISRIMNRSGYTYEEALKRIRSQMKDEDYFKIADRIIINNKGIEELRHEVENNLWGKGQNDIFNQNGS